MQFTDIEILEGNVEADEVTFYEAMQRAINEGSTWRFQGSFGRSMMKAIEDGYCLLGTVSSEDAYGNQIPSRTDVQTGTKGSREFVANHRGEDWALKMEKI
jgi:hypothetical protein